MSYMVEGGGSVTQSKAKRWLYVYPEASHQLLQLLTDVIVDYLIQQVLAGAQVKSGLKSHKGCIPEQWFLKCTSNCSNEWVGNIVVCSVINRWQIDSVL